MCRSPCGDGADFGHIEYPDSSDSEPQIKFQISNDLEKWSTNTKQTHTNVNCTRCVSDFRVNSPVCLPVCNNGSIMFCLSPAGFYNRFYNCFIRISSWSSDPRFLFAADVEAVHFVCLHVCHLPP